MNNEIWKDIPNYEGLYQASNLGRIKSLDREVTQWNRFEYIKIIYKGKILSTRKNNRGYLQCLLTKNGEPKTKLVHRLIAMTFLKDFDEKLTVDHIDCNKTNNKAENLRIITLKENIQYSYKNDLHKLKKVGKYNLQDELLEIYKSISEASRKNKCSFQLIKNCCDNKKHCKTGKGFKWKYYEEIEEGN